MSLLSRAVWPFQMALNAVYSAPQMRGDFNEVLARLDRNAGFHFSGQAVTKDNALRTTAVLGCARAIATGIAQPPLLIFERQGEGKRELARGDKKFRILTRRPNEFQTSYDWRATMTMHAVLCGGGVSLKTFFGSPANGDLRELIPIEPRHWQLIETNPHKWQISDDRGIIGTFGADQIFYLPNLMWENYKGLDALAMARNAIGLSMAAESNQARSFENGAKTDGFITTDENMTEELVERVRAQFAKTTTGKGAWGTPILDHGLKFENMSLSGKDAEQLDTRRFQVEEICRALGVYPQMVMQTDKTSTFASAEAFFAAHLRFTILPWQTAWTQRLDEFVLDGEGPLYAEFDNTALLMPSSKDLAVLISAVTTNKVLSPNEIRMKWFNAEPLPGLDEPLGAANINSPDDDGAGETDDDDEQEQEPDEITPA